MKFAYFIFFLLFVYSANAQYDPQKVNKKAVKLYQDAMLQANDEHFIESIKLLDAAVKIDDEYYCDKRYKKAAVRFNFHW